LDTNAYPFLILNFGRTVFGTIKRSFLVPFTYTYTYNKKRQDKREQIETKYSRNIFVPFSRWGEYMLKIMAWRGGTGNVSLAMNSAFMYGRNKTAFLVGDPHAYCYV